MDRKIVMTSALILLLVASCATIQHANAQSTPWEKTGPKFTEEVGASFISCYHSVAEGSVINDFCTFIRCNRGDVDLGFLATTPDTAEDGAIWHVQFDNHAFKAPFEADVGFNKSDLFITALNEEMADALAKSHVLIMIPPLKQKNRPGWIPVFSLKGSANALRQVENACPS